MADATPRTAGRSRPGEVMLCSFPTCDGEVGRVVLSGLHRRIPVAVRPHPGSVELRALVEEQAPTDAWAAAVWALPEGFRYDPLRQAWRVTRRGRERQRRAGGGDRPPVRATHHRRPEVGGVQTYAPVVPLPAVVICPRTGCERRNRVTEAVVMDVCAQMAAELNRTALAIRDEPVLADRWLAERLGLRVETLVAGLRADPELATRLAIAIPEMLLLWAACAGRPVGAKDFFPVHLPAAWMAPLPDREVPDRGVTEATRALDVRSRPAG